MAWGALGSGVRVDYPTPAPVQQAAMYFPVSTGNSSVAQLAAAATFTGTIESAQGQPAILVSLTIDQGALLSITQYIDSGGTRTAQTWNFPVVASVDPQNFCLQVVGNDVLVALKNLGASTTTTLNLNTYYGPMLPTAANGALAVAGQMSSLTAVSLATSSATQIIDCAGQSTATLAVTSVGTGGTFNITCSPDGVNWNSINTVINDAGGYSTSITATGMYQFTVTGMSFIKLTATALTSGTITGNFRCGPGDYMVALDPTGLQTAANSQSVCIASDQLAAASTQPAFTQAAHVVADRATGAINATAPSSLMYVGGSYNSTLPTLTSGQMGALQLTTKGEQLVTISNAGTAVPVVAASTANAATNAAMSVALSPNSPMPVTTSTSQACTPGLASAFTVLNIKASAGNVMGLSIYNPNATVIFLQFYNTAGTPTLGTSVTWFVPVPATGTVNIPPGVFALANHTTGIGIGASTTATSTGTPATAPSATIFYK